MITVRLDSVMEQRLQRLAEMEHTTRSEIIKRALAAYDEKKMASQTPYQIGEALFGRFGEYENSDEDLSVTYKERLREKLNAKHSR